MNDRHPVTYPDPYTSHIPSGLSLPPIDISSQNSFQKPRSQGYYGGHGGAGRYYDQREKEIQQVGKDMRRWPPCAVAAPEAAHAGALRRNGSSASSSRGHGHGKEKERKEIPERPANERKSSRLVENCCSVGAREQGNPLRELEQLRFTPKVTAGTHLRRFERLAGMAYPGVSSGGKWSMFVKTLNYPGLWSKNDKISPGRWAIELKKTENMSFDHMKALFIDRWGTREEREQFRSSAQRKKEKDREREEKDHQYLHQQLITTADSLPKKSSMLPHLVIHQGNERPAQAQGEVNAPDVGERIVATAEQRAKDRPRERYRKGNGEWGQEQERDRDQKSARSVSRSTSTALKTGSSPCSPRIISLSPPLPSLPPPSGAEECPWGTEQGKEKSLQDHPQKGDHEWDSRRTGQGEPSQEESSNYGNNRDWGAPESSPPLHQATSQLESPIAGDWGGICIAPKSPRHMEQLPQESNSTTMAAAPGQGALSSPADPIPPPLIEGPVSLRPPLLEGKVAAVTGASRGIGRAISLGFAREGAHIVAHYWGTISDPSNDDIVSLATEIRGMGQRCEVVFGDISNPDTSDRIVQKAVEEFGRLDIGVGNAGMCWFRDFWDITPELMRRHVDVNLNGNMWFVQACARQMKAQYVTATKTALDEDSWTGDGDLQDIPDHSLLLVSSTTSMTASPAAAHYAASSAGIISLVQSMAVELGKYAIRCNALLPGTVMTRMVKEGVEDVDRRRGMERRVPPLGRLGRPRDVVGPAIFLAGEQSRYVTGAKLAVDGGASAGGVGGW